MSLSALDRALAMAAGRPYEVFGRIRREYTGEVRHFRARIGALSLDQWIEAYVACDCLRMALYGQGEYFPELPSSAPCSKEGKFALVYLVVAMADGQEVEVPIP